jgi:uncharacterized protein (DUF1330 family)
MPAYVIVQGVVTDAEQFEHYKPASGPTVTAAGGRYIVRGGTAVSLEGGAPPERTTILEFPTMEAAQAWYRSTEYQAARALRDGAAEMRLYVVDGVS